MGFSVLDSLGRIKVNKIGTPGPRGVDGTTGATGAVGPSGGMIIVDDPYIDEFVQKGVINLAGDVYGSLPPTNLASGVGADTSTFWRGDGSWAQPGFVGFGPGGTGADADTGSPELFLIPDSASSVNGNITGTATAGTSQLSDVDGPWVRHTATVDGTVVQYRSANTQAMPDSNIKFWTRIRTGSDITNVRIWLGLASAAFTNVDTLVANGVAIRYSTAVPDGGWVGVCRSVATGLQSTTGTIAAIAASTKYNISVSITGAGTLATFTVNGASQTLTTNIPTGVMLLISTAIIRVSTANKILDVKYIKLWR